jgi:HEAT repeat protein
MTPYTAQIADLLHRFRKGCREEAFFGLLEMGHDVLPELMAAFRAERDAQVRAFIVEVVWQHRQQSVIPFLGEALRDPEPAVWRQALDGLVTLASPAALEVLRSARTRQFPNSRDTDEFRRWLEEAIAQAEEGTRGG